MTIRLATRHDVPSLLALEERHFVGNLPESELDQGFISILHPREWFERAVDQGGVHVATVDGDVVGFIVVTEPPSASAEIASPIMRKIVELTTSVSFDGRPIAEQRYALRGPVLIDRSARGRGLYSAFNAITGDAYRQRFDIGVLFVAAANPRSVHTTTTRLGATSLATFEVEGRDYHLMAFRF